MLDILQETLRYIQEQNELLSSFKSIIVEKEEQYKTLHSKICYQILEEMQKDEICKEEDVLNNEQDDFNNEEDVLNNEEEELNNEEDVLNNEEEELNNEDDDLYNQDEDEVMKDDTANLNIVKEETLNESFEEEECQQSPIDSNEDTLDSSQDEDKMQLGEFPVQIKIEHRNAVIQQNDSIDQECGLEYEESPETSNENFNINIDSIFTDEHFDDNLITPTNYQLSDVCTNETNNVLAESGNNLNIDNEITSANKWLLGNISNDRPFPYQTIDDALGQIAGSSNVFATEPTKSVAVSNQTTLPQSLHKCPYCDNSFQFHELETHIMRVHTHSEKPHPCLFCKMSFKRKSNLDIHMRLHTGEKPYNCEFCGMPFRQLSHLINHRRRHTGEKPFQCPICHRSFGQKSGLIYHNKRFHNSQNECIADNGTNS